MNDRFLKACHREPVDMTPVWFMRQAGRYMSAYRGLRERYSLLEICRQPELAAQVTLQPVDAIEVDAAILFSDLLLPLEPMGIPFDFVKGEGPVIDPPVRTVERIEQLCVFEPRESLGHVLDTIRLLRVQLADRVPLIGFAGAPFTLASYAIEGGPSSNYARTKALMYGEPKAWHQLADTFATVVADYLHAQIEAGVQAVQVFDSWVGALSPRDYREFALPHTRKIFDTVRSAGVPMLQLARIRQQMVVQAVRREPRRAGDVAVAAVHIRCHGAPAAVLQLAGEPRCRHRRRGQRRARHQASRGGRDAEPLAQ